MAITWTVNITNVDVDEKRADINFARLDDVEETTETYSFKKTIIETGAQKAALLNQVWNMHLAAVVKQTAIDSFVSDLEQAAKANLEAREE